MKLFGKKPRQEPEGSESACTHPVSHHVLLREDPSDRLKTTGIRCTQCGARLANGQHLQKTA